MNELASTSDVIEALGGATAVAALFGYDPKVVYNWKAMPRFPAKTFIVLKAALTVRGLSAPDDLWAMARSVAAESLGRSIQGVIQ